MRLLIRSPSLIVVFVVGSSVTSLTEKIPNCMPDVSVSVVCSLMAGSSSCARRFCDSMHLH